MPSSYEPVARFHVSRSNSPDLSDDDDDDDLDVDERQSFISFRGMRRTPSSHGKTFKAILHHIDSQFFYFAPFDPFL